MVATIPGIQWNCKILWKKSWNIVENDISWKNLILKIQEYSLILRNNVGKILEYC